ncbi:uncharacterized protein Z520_00174 [Fonsecaea multimorphosa CBS 102226]|uniref:Dynamin stalk domain-containing protein n=1 Tax=Fonsecaea multimorphosa CBS 102226 TaxID=1442371 RepID=A0A0D2KBQ0_9EURO|nr:uncharacterized protein Z520_00174 [Fonsecaea multimorphosa CBS 102226]KIY03483.1 hypothetical protein Z520_00174 [Fonsecaea multimorphosa CBS 102226]OAL32740.1 hypothetical protein AYO22_00214 [Fonsecaea multimorphosa]
MERDQSVFATKVREQINIWFDENIDKQFDARFRMRFNEEFGDALKPRFDEMAALVREKTVEEVRTRVSDTVERKIVSPTLNDILERTIAQVRAGENSPCNPSALPSPKADEGGSDEVLNQFEDVLYKNCCEEVKSGGRFEAKFKAAFEAAFIEAFPEIFDEKFDEVRASVFGADSPLCP